MRTTASYNKRLLKLAFLAFKTVQNIGTKMKQQQNNNNTIPGNLKDKTNNNNSNNNAPQK